MLVASLRNRNRERVRKPSCVQSPPRTVNNSETRISMTPLAKQRECHRSIPKRVFETPAPGACEAMPQRKRPRIVLADDDEQVGAAVSRMLLFSCDVIGCVRDADTLLETVMQLRPDVVLLDFSLPGRLNALQACRLMQAMTPQVRTVAFTADNDAELRRAAYEAGASGFVWKMQLATDLLPAIQAAVDGTSRHRKDNSV